MVQLLFCIFEDAEFKMNLNISAKKDRREREG
jgi:hypothetical protein